jgi:acylphosphatase
MSKVHFLQRIRLIAAGRVQGVGFRAFACRIGRECGLCGYAKNLEDGTVEIVAEGKPEKIEEFCRRISVKLPAGPSVERLEVKEQKEVQEKGFAGFLVRY